MNILLYLLLSLFFCNNVSVLSFKTKRLVNNFTMKKEKFKDNMKSLSQYYKPVTENQKKYVDTLNDNRIPLVVVIGPAGTGKTLLACNNAIKMLKNGNIDKIIITRPVVPVEEDIGFLPGNLNKKMDPWTRPIFDVFSDFFSQTEINLMIQNNVIEIAPLAYMRGRTFKNSFIIADEMQNSSPNQMKMLTTRIGENSKLVITGDLKQSDKVLNIKESGLFCFLEKYKIYQGKYNKSRNSLNDNYIYQPLNIKCIELDNTDIQRNPIIDIILKIFDEKF